MTDFFFLVKQMFHLVLLSFWTLSIGWYSKEYNISETESVSTPR
jgi:hypothetical protein